MGVISEFLRVHMVAAAPIASPSLTQLGILGTTPGKSNTVRDKLMAYGSINSLAVDYDPADAEYTLASKVFAQGSVLNRPDKVFVFNGTRTDYRLATVTNGTQGANNGLTITADKYGDFGDRIAIEWIGGTANEDEPSLASLDKYLLTGALVDNNALKITQAEDVEKIVRITFKDPELPNETLSIRVLNRVGLVPDTELGYRTAQGVFDYNIEVSLATNFVEEIITTAQEIADALTLADDPAYDALAARLVDCVNQTGSSGAGVVEAFAATSVPIKIKVHLKTEGAGATDTQAWLLRDWINQDTTIAPLMLVSDTGVSNGNGTVAITAVNEVQTVTLTDATGGTFTLSFRGATTGNIAFNASAATVQTALEALSTIAVGQVAVTGAAGGPYTVKFLMGLGGEDVDELVADGALLTGVGADIAVAETTPGVAAWLSLNRLTNATASPLELVRMVLAAYKYCEISRIEKPYFWISTSVEDVEGDTEELSLYFATQRAIYITTNKTGETSLEIKARIDDLVSDRTGFVAHDEPNVRADAATAGYFKALVQAFVGGGNGAFTLFYGPLNTIPAATWTDTDRLILFGNAPGAAGAITYMEDFDTSPGTFLIVGSWSTSGDFLDRRWKKDWMQLQMTLTLFRTQRQNVGGIPYDNEGIGILECAVDERMAVFVRRRLVAARDGANRAKGVYKLNFPRIEEVDVADWEKRLYRANVQYQEAGVIEQVDLVMESGFFARTL